MRTLGPGSISSFLKVVLDVAYVVMMIVTGAVLLAAVAILIALPFASTIHLQLDNVRIDPAHLPVRMSAAEVLVLLTAIYLGLVVVVLNRLRRVFGALTRGEPFQPENVGRLRVIGLALIGIQVFGHILHMAPGAVFGEHGHAGFSISLSAWFSILVVFVLAEVFREGARLRREAELTI
jgi:hypothetical protein